MNNKVKAIIDAAPERCPITGLKKCTSYIFDNKAVYVPDPAYDAYTLPEYDPIEQAFYRTKIDMDDDFRQETEWLCDLDDLKGRVDFQQIKEFYGIRYCERRFGYMHETSTELLKELARER